MRVLALELTPRFYGMFLVFLGLGYLVPVIFEVPNITRSRNCGERLSESYTSIILIVIFEASKGAK